MTRSQALFKLIAGYSIYLICLCKNNFFEPQVEARFRDLSIVANVMYTNAEPDMEGATRLLSSALDSFDDAEAALDADSMRRLPAKVGTGSSRSRKKGSQPTDIAEQRRWAPLLYFAHALAGNVIGIANKSGAFTMAVNYLVVHIMDFMYKGFYNDIRCLVSEDDCNNASRYFECQKCRHVAKATLEETIRCMFEQGSEGTLFDAAVETAKRLTFNALDLSLIPALFDRFLQRLIKFEPILAICTVGLALEIPVLSLQSVILFLRGRANEMDEDDRSVLTSFCEKCWRNSMFMNESTFGGDACHGHGDYPIPYITTGGAWAGAEPGADSLLREKIVRSNEITAETALESISKKLYNQNASVLKFCAFVKEFSTFMSAMRSLTSSYDLRHFFGGLERFHDTRFLLESLGLRWAPKFKNGFLNAQAGGVDRILEVGRVDVDVYCCGVRIWDALLFLSICSRPRRDSSLMDDFCRTLVQYQIEKLPTRLFPFASTLVGKMDSITERHR